LGGPKLIIQKGARVVRRMSDKLIIEHISRILDELDIEFLKDASVLVTGGAGFIGSWLCDVLVKAEARVTCLDNFSTGLNENIVHLLNEKGFKLIKLDVEFLNDAVGRFDFILHLASRASPEEYQKHPIETLTVNSLGSFKVIEQALKSNATVLFTSTSEVYGDAQVIPTPESYWGNVNPTGPRSGYDEGKRFSEALFTAYHREHGLDTRILRVFNTYGPRLRADGIYGRVISRFILQALQNQPLTVYGDGTQSRSFCYITDTVLGILKALTNKQARGEIINIGNTHEIKILHLAEKIRKLTGSKSKIVFQPLPPEDPKRRCPDISKAKRLLNWQPEDLLEEGLNKTIEWFKLKLGLETVV